MVRCWYCGKEIDRNSAFDYKVRVGISRREFPNFDYEDVILCGNCLELYHKKEKKTRISASILLLVVIGIIVFGLYLAFTA